MPPSETPLEQAARHVRKGQAHITAQEAVVRRLERDGPSEQLEAAREVLARLREFQILAADRFGQELRKLSSVGQGADTSVRQAVGPLARGTAATAGDAGTGSR